MKNHSAILSFISFFLLYVLGVSCLSAVSTAQAQEHTYLRVEAGGHNGQVHAVLFTPDGQNVISVGYDKVVRVWDANEPYAGQLRTFRYDIGEGIRGEMTAAAIHPDKTHHELAIGEKFSDGKGHDDVLIIDYDSGRILKRLSTDGVVTVLKYSNSDGERLAAGTNWGTIHVWSGSAKTSLTNWGRIGSKAEGKAGDYVEGLAFSPDNAQIAAAFKDGEKKGYVQYCALKSHNLGKHEEWNFPIKSIDWAKDTQTLAWGDQQGVVSLLNPKQASAVSLTNQGGSVTCLAFSADGKQILDGSGEKTGEAHNVHVWSVEDVTNVQEITTFGEHRSPVLAVALSPDGAKAASADSGGRIYLWNARTGKELAAFKGEGDPLERVRWSPDGQNLAWGDQQHGTKYIFNLSQMMPAPAVKPGADWKQYQTTLDDMRLTASPDNKTLLIWKTEKGKEREFNRIAFDNLQCFTFTPDGRIVVGADGIISLYNVQAKQKEDRLCVFEGHEGTVFAVAVSPAAPHYLATASKDRTVRVWSLDSAAWTLKNNVGIASPLLSLFMTDTGRWIAWTQAGYYYASPDGEALIGWHENKGPNQPAVFHSTNDFKTKFRSRKAVSLVFDTGSVKQAIVQLNQQGQKLDANATILQEIQTTPHLALVSVEGAQKVGEDGLTWTTDQPKAVVRVKLANVANPANIELKLSRQYGSLSPAATKHLELKRQQPADQRALTVDLLADDNAIRIQARKPGEDACYGDPLVLHIHYTPPPNEDVRPSLYAQTIGVQEFADKLIMAEKVSYTVADAKGISQLCQDKTKGIFKNTTVEPPILDKDATPENVKNAVSAIMQKANKGDVVLLYLSSHAMPPPPNAGRGLASLYFAMHDTTLDDPAKFYKSSLACNDLLTAISENIKDTVKVLLILDTCYSAKFADAEAYNDAVGRLREHMYVLTSCDINQESMEDVGWGHGLFTGALLDMFRPGVALGPLLNSKGEITLHALQYYVGQRMQDRIQEKADIYTSHRQNPKLYGPGDEYFPLFKVR